MPLCNVISFANPVPYPNALALQRRLVDQRAENLVPDTLLLLEHPPTVTIGRSAKPDDLLVPAGELQRRGIAVEHVDRGGQITYHAPGQLVGYPIFDLREHGRDLHVYLRSLEEVVIRALYMLDIVAGRRAGLTGVWVGDAKIAAIGIKVTRWISLHGFALNIDPDLGPFRNDFVPCGITDLGVTSLAELLPHGAPSREQVETLLVAEIAHVFGVNPHVSHATAEIGG